MARGDIVVRLIGDTSDLERKFASAATRIGALGSRMQRVGQQMSTAGRSLTVGLTLPILAVGAGAIKSAIDFETAFSGIRKTVDATEGQFQKLSDGIRKMAKETGTSANDLAAIGEAAGALGIATEDILEFIGVVNRLDVATDLTSEAASTALGKLKNVLDLTVGDLENFSAAIVDLGNTGSSTEPEIVDLALRIAGAGRNAGLSAAEILGLSAAVADAGINAERGGTAVQKTLQDMALAVTNGGKELATFGKVAGTTGAEFAEAFGEDPATATASFVEGLQRIHKEAGPGGVLTVLKDLGITESRQVATLQTLSQAQSTVTDKLRQANKAYADGTAAQEEFEKKQATTERRLAMLRERFRDVGITLGEALIPVLEQATPVIEAIAGAIERAAQWFSNLPGPVKTVLVVIAGLVAVIGPLLVVLGAIVSGVGAMMTLFSALAPLLGVVGAAIGAISVPVLIVIGVIAALIAIGVLLWKHWDKVSRALKVIWNAIKAVASAIFGFLKFLFLNFTPVGLIIKHWDSIKGFLSRTWNTIKAVAGPIFRFLKDLFLNFTPIGQIIKHWDKIVEVISGLKAKIRRVASGMWDGITDAFRSAINWIIDGWNGMEFRIPGFDPPGPGPKFGGFTLGLPDIPRLGTGGIVTSPTIAMLAEAGEPEAVIPLSKLKEGGGRTYLINVSVPPTANKAEIGREIVGAINAYERGNGTRWRDS